MSLAPAQRGRASDTIFALASGVGRSAIAVIRLSGARARAILASLCDVPAPRHAGLRALRDPEGGLLDHALVLWFPGPGSYTGEDSAELQVHGGRAVIQAVTSALLHAGARPADAGEFTRRAFLAGRMSLLEAEAVADLTASDTDAQRVQALRQLDGGAGALVQDWSGRLTRCLAFQEALIDFPDDNLPASVEQENAGEIGLLLQEIDGQITAAAAGAKLRAGLVFVIAGPPNVGKSSLFNALAGREAAIVSPRPGTTRDSLEIQLDLSGILVTLVDTAGLRDTADEIEAEGVRRTRDRMRQADLVIVLSEANAALERVPEHTGAVSVASKCDLAAAPAGMLGVSTKSGQGLSELLAILGDHARDLVRSEHDPLLSRARHVAALRDTRNALRSALDADQPELRAEDLRLARVSLARLTGEVDVEAVLDVVFGAFCIGK